MAVIQGELTNLSEKTWKKEGEPDKVYFILTLGKKNPTDLSVWQVDLMKGVKIGDKLKIDYEQRGNYKNAISLEVVEESGAKPAQRTFSEVTDHNVVPEKPKPVKKESKSVETKSEEPMTESTRGVTDASKVFDKDFLVSIKGKNFVRFNGLLDLAHKKGLKEMVITQMNVSQDGNAAWCIGYVKVEDRITWMSGSANASTLKEHLLGYEVEMAATRMFARALRNALNVDFVSVEEMAEKE